MKYAESVTFNFFNKLVTKLYSFIKKKDTYRCKKGKSISVKTLNVLQ